MKKGKSIKIAVGLLLAISFVLGAGLVPTPAFAGEITNNNRWDIRSNRNPAQIKYAFDGSLQTVWDSATPQRADDYITIDFGKKVLVNGILLIAEDREKPRRYPRAVNVFISPDGEQWKLCGGKQVFRKDRAIEFIPYVSIPLELSLTRFLKISLADSAGISWSIAECLILGKEDIKQISTDRSVIVTPADACPAILFAAEELREYLGKMGYLVKIKKDENIDPKMYPDCIFRLGKDYLKKRSDRNALDLGNDGYIIKNNGKEVYISGNTGISVLYGVYTLLERLGVRWFYPGEDGENISENFDVKVLRKVEIVERPSFSARGFIESAFLDPQKILWCVRNKINTMGVSAKWAANFLFYAADIEKIGGKDYYYSNAGWMWPHGHSFQYFMNTRDYFKEHPEYFPLIDGKRVGGDSQQLCTSNPEVIRIFKEKILDYLSTNPPSKIVSVTPNDGAVKWCQCENCQKLDGPNPKEILWGKTLGREVSDRNLIFVREIAQEVQKKYPEAKVLAWGYSVFHKPPLYIKEMPDNVILEICQYDEPAQIPGTVNVKRSEDCLKVMRGWATIKGPELSIYDYFLLRTNHPRTTGMHTPLFFTEALFHKLRLYRDELNVKYYRTQFSWSVQEDNPLLFYAYVKALWNVHTNEQEFYRDFFEKYYGIASEPMESYFTMMMERVKEKKILYGMNYDCPPPEGLYDAEIIPVIDKLFERANLLAGKNYILKQRIQRDFNAYQYAKRYLKLAQ